MNNDQNMDQIIEPMWDVSDVSRTFNVRPGTIRYWCHVHAVTFHKIGSLVRFKPSELLADFENGRLGKAGSCISKRGK